ncbi:hypothetical protein F4815DRAFT_11557 [Daldinia loculata]|nr:hypothetical protein F4815DRAFT_11557 [Daldinia loculata]
MMLGLIRGAARDNPTLDYLLLDTEDADRIDHCVIAETMLRYMAASQWWQRDNMKLTVENELVLDKAGRLLIPRLVMNEEMNDRYNSNHRDIRRQVKLDHHRIGIFVSDSRWDVELKPPVCPQGYESIQLQTTHSLLSPIRVLVWQSGLGYDKITRGRGRSYNRRTSWLHCPYRTCFGSTNNQPARRTPACVGVMATDESLGPRL